MPRVTVNGKVMEVREGMSVADLIEEVVIPPGNLVVEKNREVLGPDRYGDTSVCEGDVIELVRFVGGG